MSLETSLVDAPDVEAPDVDAPEFRIRSPPNSGPRSGAMRGGGLPVGFEWRMDGPSVEASKIYDRGSWSVDAVGDADEDAMEMERRWPILAFDRKN